ncbi:MAG: acetyl-coenzyme A synthetase N-terminal domain-containing protein, partial [Nisaea sp.]
MGQFDDVYRHSLDDPEAFWGAAADDIFWFKRWDKVLDESNPPFYRWFAGGTTNTCYNALDRHVEEGRGDQAALIYDSPVTNTKQSFSYSELTDKVAAFAGVLSKYGLGYGDRVIIYMP